MVDLIQTNHSTLHIPPEKNELQRLYYCPDCGGGFRIRVVDIVYGFVDGDHPPCPSIDEDHCNFENVREATATVDVSDWVGEFSQNVYECSYNEDWVRWAWRKELLNEQVENFRVGYSADIFNSRMKGFYRKDGDYQSALTALVKAAGGWPIHYSFDPADLDPLTDEEMQLIVD